MVAVTINEGITHVTELYQDTPSDVITYFRGKSHHMNLVASPKSSLHTYNKILVIQMDHTRCHIPNDPRLAGVEHEPCPTL